MTVTGFIIILKVLTEYHQFYSVGREFSSGKQVMNQTRPLVHHLIFGVLLDSDQTQPENPALVASLLQ